MESSLKNYGSSIITNENPKKKRTQGEISDNSPKEASYQSKFMHISLYLC